MITGIAGVSLSIKEKLSAWPLFILCYLSYVYIGFRSHYIAFGVMNIIFIGVAAYGWYQWAAPAKDNQANTITISHLGNRSLLVNLLLITLGTLGFGYLLSLNEAARLPYFDAFATCCALSAQWMLSRKYIENWFLWIASDLVYLSFYYRDKIWPSVVLFSVFIILAIKGWNEWKSHLHTTHPTS